LGGRGVMKSRTGRNALAVADLDAVELACEDRVELDDRIAAAGRRRVVKGVELSAKLNAGLVLEQQVVPHSDLLTVDDMYSAAHSQVEEYVVADHRSVRAAVETDGVFRRTGDVETVDHCPAGVRDVEAGVTGQTGVRIEQHGAWPVERHRPRRVCNKGGLAPIARVED